MGGVVGVPLRMAASCLGTCIGFGFFKLADTGTVTTMVAVRCVLFWLQVSGAALAWTASHSPHGWVETACGKLSLVGYADLGVCECQGSPEESECFSEQLAFRATAVTALVFGVLLIFAVSGCALGAARYHETGKFLFLLVLWVVSLFAPNGIFDGFALVATVVSCFFVLVQSIIALDVTCTWHERWYAFADSSGERDRKSLHQVAIIATSAAFFVGAIGLAVLLWRATSGGLAHFVVLATEALGLALLVLSITDWCEHGTLLTSSVMMLYNTWLAHEALTSACPGDLGGSPPQILPRWLGLLLCGVTVFFLAAGIGFGSESDELQTQLRQQQSQTLLTVAPGDSAAVVRVASMMSKADTNSFIAQCAAHMLVPLYIAGTLAQQSERRLRSDAEENCGAFAAHALVAFLSQLVYGWHLVAPKVLTGRQF